MKRMKRMLAILLTLVMLLSISCTTALAAGEAEEPAEEGIYAVTILDEYKDVISFTVQDEDGQGIDGVGATIDGDDAIFYAGGKKVEFSINDAGEGNLYMFFALNEKSDTPPAEYIEFVDQAVGGEVEEGKASCAVYPMTNVAGEPYYIYISSDEEGGAFEQIGSFKYYESYLLGDVDDNGDIDSYDALLALLFSVQKTSLTATQQKAADVDKNGDVDSYDALLILLFSVDKILSFE